jgi:ABC-2 type transport system ATP-binding protein
VKVFTAHEVRFGYSRKSVVLDGVTAEFNAGKIYGLLGKNGEGKTTLLKLACGLRYASEGTLSVLGIDPRRRGTELLEQVCLLPEETPVFPISPLRFAALRAPFHPKFSASDFAGLLKEFEVPADKSIAQMSHGQRKKAALAFALATNCRLLLLDEPTNGLDIPSKSVFRRLVAKALDPQRCIVISTHQVRDVEDLIDSVAILDHGRIVLQTSLGDVASKLTLTDEPAGRTVLYSEENAAGRRSVVISNSSAAGVSRIDLELLFNAAISNSREISAALEGRAAA